jgi:hypothetical protein
MPTTCPWRIRRYIGLLSGFYDAPYYLCMDTTGKEYTHQQLCNLYVEKVTRHDAMSGPKLSSYLKKIATQGSILASMIAADYYKDVWTKKVRDLTKSSLNKVGYTADRDIPTSIGLPHILKGQTIPETTIEHHKQMQERHEIARKNIMDNAELEYKTKTLTVDKKEEVRKIADVGDYNYKPVLDYYAEIEKDQDKTSKLAVYDDPFLVKHALQANNLYTQASVSIALLRSILGAIRASSSDPPEMGQLLNKLTAEDNKRLQSAVTISGPFFDICQNPPKSPSDAAIQILMRASGLGLVPRHAHFYYPNGNMRSATDMCKMTSVLNMIKVN